MAKFRSVREARPKWEPHSEIVMSAKEHDALRNLINWAVENAPLDVLDKGHWICIKEIREGLNSRLD